MNIRGEAAIVGIGSTPFMRNSPHSALALACQAFKEAIDDAGLSRDQVDGVTTHYGAPLGADYDRFAEALGLNLRHAAQYWMHGRFITTTLQNAAFAVMGGLADVVACVTPVKFFSVRAGLGGDGDHENRREGGGSHGEEPNFGLTSPAGGAALGVQRYFHQHGVDGTALRDVVLSARAHAARNPRAMRREPFDAEAYYREPAIIDPLRRADCSLLSDGAVVVLVTTAERAKTLKKPPIYLKGMQGMRAGRDEFCFAQRGVGVLQQGVLPGAPEPYPHQVFDMAGLKPSDIDAFYTYDAFSPLILYALERFGHCAPGAAPRFIADGGIAPGGKLPVNTSGGLLAEAHVGGWNSIAEIVRQLRGEAGPTQIAKADNLQWGASWGDSIIFGTEA